MNRTDSSPAASRASFRPGHLGRLGRLGRLVAVIALTLGLAGVAAGPVAASAGFHCALKATSPNAGKIHVIIGSCDQFWPDAGDSLPGDPWSQGVDKVRVILYTLDKHGHRDKLIYDKTGNPDYFAKPHFASGSISHAPGRVVLYGETLAHDPVMDTWSSASGPVGEVVVKAPKAVVVKPSAPMPHTDIAEPQGLSGALSLGGSLLLMFVGLGILVATRRSVSRPASTS